MARNALEAAGIPAILDGEVAATWLWHLGTALGGVKLLVSEGDAGEARAILQHRHADDIPMPPPAEADSLEAAQREPEREEEVAGPSPIVARAWRAAIIGVLLLPPILNLYSMWLLVRHQLLFGKKTRPGEWRTFAAFAVNATVLSAAGLLVYLVAMNSSPNLRPSVPGGEPLTRRRTITIPVVPFDSPREDPDIGRRGVNRAHD